MAERLRHIVKGGLFHTQEPSAKVNVQFLTPSCRIFTRQDLTLHQLPVRWLPGSLSLSLLSPVPAAICFRAVRDLLGLI